jgi:cell division control protein 45
VVLFWDQNNVEIPSDGDNLSGTESTTDEDDSSSEDGSEESSLEAEFEQDLEEEEDDTQVPATARASPREDDADYDGEDEDDDDAMDDEDDDDDRSTTRSKHAQKTNKADDTASMSGLDEQQEQQEPEETLSPRELHRQRRDRLRLYYSGGSYYGVPASYVAFLLSTQLRFGQQGDLLWYATVGVTDAYLHARLDMYGYANLALSLRSHTLRLFPNDEYHRVGNAIFAEHLQGSSSTSLDLTHISVCEAGRVVCESDFLFFLLRHSSLYDSMVYSNAVSTKMQLWTARGLQNLQELLAKMGCPLEECRQPFPFMKPALRRTLRDKFLQHGEEYGLENLEFTSFKRVTGYKSFLSASDMAYAVTALLECDTPATMSISGKHDEEQEALRAFNIAYDALATNSSTTVILNEGHAVSNLVNGGDMSGNEGVGAGIRLAMSLQKSIIATAASLVDRKAISTLRHFRYALITCTSQESQGDDDMGDDDDGSDETANNVFAKPIALSKLAHYLMDMHRSNGKWTGEKSRPLILAAEKPRTKTYMIVGYEYPEHAGTIVKNRFGQNFELAAKTMKGTFRFDSFDSNVVEVDGKDVQRFMEQLHYMMDSM